MVQKVGKEEHLTAATQQVKIKTLRMKIFAKNKSLKCRLNSDVFVENKNFTNSRHIFKLFCHLDRFTQNYTASPLLLCGLQTMTSFQRIQYGTWRERRVGAL